MKQALTTLILAPPVIWVTYDHLGHDYHGLLDAAGKLAWPLSEPKVLLPVAGYLIAILVGLRHLKHSVMELAHRSVLTGALGIILVLSITSLVAGGSGLFGLMLYWRFTGAEIVDPPVYVLWMLGMIWGGGASAVASFFGLAVLDGSGGKAPARKSGGGDSGPRPPPSMTKYLA